MQVKKWGNGFGETIYKRANPSSQICEKMLRQIIMNEM